NLQNFEGNTPLMVLLKYHEKGSGVVSVCKRMALDLLAHSNFNHQVLNHNHESVLLICIRQMLAKSCVVTEPLPLIGERRQIDLRMEDQLIQRDLYSGVMSKYNAASPT